MLQFNVSQLLKSTIGTMREYHVDDSVNIEGSPVNVKGDIRMTRIDQGILVQGKLESAMEAACCRCLDLFSCPININLEEQFLPIVDVQSGYKLEAPLEPETFTLDERHTLDLTEAIRQYAILALPMKPLCRPDCAGVKIETQNN